MQKIPVTFEHNGKKYLGMLDPVFGAGNSSVYYLMIDGYYCGRLRFTDQWIFDSTP